MNTELANKIAQLKANEELLKTIFTSPRLYLSECFSEVITQIDIAAELLLAAKDDPTSKQQKIEINKIFKNWELMVDTIKNFQTECLKNFPLNKFDERTTDFVNNSIKSAQESIQNIENIAKLISNKDTSVNDDDNDEVDKDMEFFEEKYTDLDDLIYNATFKLQKVLNGDRCVFFLERDLFDGYVDESYFIGKLIIVKDAFFGARGIANIRFVIDYNYIKD